MKKLEKTSLIITICWIFIALGFAIAKSFWNLSLNELGDFLAGVFSPVAFLWLIVGYYLQREELHNNTQALIDQKNELIAQNKILQKTSGFTAMMAMKTGQS